MYDRRRLSIFENISVFLEAPQVRLEQVKHSLASDVSMPAALKRTMRPFCCCTMRRPSATSSSTRRRSFSESICQNNAQRRKRAQDSSLKRAAEEPSAGSAEFDGSHALVRSRRVPSANCSSYRGVPTGPGRNPTSAPPHLGMLNCRALVTASGARIDAVYRWWSRGPCRIARTARPAYTLGVGSI